MTDKIYKFKESKFNMIRKLFSSFLFSVVLISLFSTVVFSSGWHTANEVLSGNFSSGNYSFPNYLGVGISTPQRNLHVEGGAGHSVIHLTNNFSGHNITDGLDIFVISNAVDAWIRQNEDGPLIFATNLTEKMRILSNGNVGIGTTTPNQKLEVIGSTNITGNLTVGTSSFVNGNLSVGTGAVPQTQLDINGRWFVSSHGTSPTSGAGMFGSFNPAVGNGIGIIQAWNYSSGVARNISLQSAGGDVGIGTTAPTQKLHVSGNVNVTGNISVGSGRMVWNGTCTIIYGSTSQIEIC